MSAPRIFLGVDVGGTGSRALLADETGKQLALEQGLGGNLHHSIEKVVESLVEAILKKANIGRDALAGAGFGLSGYDWPSESELAQAVIRSLRLSCPVSVDNDATMALFAGAESGWGVAVIAGSSCNCRGIDQQGRMGRVTGFGRRMGEGAGGFELVAKAMEAVAHAWTRRGDGTSLSEVMVGALKANDVRDLIEGVMQSRYLLTPEAAPLVFAEAERGDEVAARLVRWAGAELGNLAVAVVRQLGLASQAFDLVLAGRLFRAGMPLVVPLQQVVLAEAPHARFHRPDAPPVVGAVRLAMRAASCSTEVELQAWKTLSASFHYRADPVPVLPRSRAK
jgi:N-acetylglucosamine kinase-like BadF-type ATPase